MKMTKQQGLSNFDEDGILFGDSEPVEKPAIESNDVVKPATCRVSHSMTLRSHKNSPIQVDTASKTPKRDVISDGKKKVTWNTQVQRITLENGISVVEEEKKGNLRGLINSALFTFNTSREPKTDDEALNGTEKDRSIILLSVLDYYYYYYLWYIEIGNTQQLAHSLLMLLNCTSYFELQLSRQPQATTMYSKNPQKSHL